MATYWENNCSFGLRYVFMVKVPDHVIVNLVFPTSVFGVGIFFLIAPFPDLRLLVPFYTFCVPVNEHWPTVFKMQHWVRYVQTGRL